MSSCIINNEAGHNQGGALAVEEALAVLSDTAVGWNSEPWVWVNRSEVAFNSSVVTSDYLALWGSACQGVNESTLPKRGTQTPTALLLSSSKAVADHSDFGGAGADRSQPVGSLIRSECSYLDYSNPISSFWPQNQHGLIDAQSQCTSDVACDSLLGDKMLEYPPKAISDLYAHKAAICTDLYHRAVSENGSKFCIKGAVCTSTKRCSANTTTKQVNCAHSARIWDFEESRFCVPVPSDSKRDTDLNVVLGGLAATVAAACVGLLLFYMRRYPHHAVQARWPSPVCPHASPQRKTQLYLNDYLHVTLQTYGITTARCTP